MTGPETFSPHGADLFGAPTEHKHTSKLGDEFMIPPFTVLNAREGWWQDRKRAWLALGIQSELGRGDAVPGPAGNSSVYRSRDNLGSGSIAETSPAASQAPT